MKRIIIANFKSNKTTDNVTKWIKIVDKHPAAKLSTTILSLGHTHLYLAGNLKNLKLAAQNVSPFPPGSYTGEVNAVQLKEQAVSYCIIGHSERRRYFRETDQEIANKADNLLEQKIIPIICLDKPYLHSQISALSAPAITDSLFAYEPASDIGGTVTAPVGELSSTLNAIQQLLRGNRSIIYGGSVNANNITSLLNLDSSGFLISTASLKTASFISILEAVASHG